MKIKVIFFGLVIVMAVILGLVYLNTNQVKSIISPQLKSENVDILAPPLSPTPKPVPVVFDGNTNLKLELEKLTPQDFSEDFKNLKEEALTW